MESKTKGSGGKNSAVAVSWGRSPLMPLNSFKVLGNASCSHYSQILFFCFSLEEPAVSPSPKQSFPLASVFHITGEQSDKPGIWWPGTPYHLKKHASRGERGRVHKAGYNVGEDTWGEHHGESRKWGTLYSLFVEAFRVRAISACLKDWSANTQPTVSTFLTASC